jgi:hypothetical protein
LRPTPLPCNATKGLSEVTTIGKRFVVISTDDHGRYTVVGDGGPTFGSSLFVGDQLPNSIYNPAEWHFAAT